MRSAWRRNVPARSRWRPSKRAVTPAERGGDLGVVELEDVLDDAGDPALAALAGEGVAGHEQLRDHPGRVRDEPERVAGGQRVGHQAGTGSRAHACWSVVISASVDSVPSLRLAPSACSPS